MERMTLREAAERTSRSITTLRRYIRSGRLHAEKRYGRFGPEYFVSAQDLTDAGLDHDPRELERALEPARQERGELVRAADTAFDGQWLREIVPLALFQELQMKHEQLLVQYGMVRAGGLRSMELKADLEARCLEIDALQEKVKALEMMARNAVTTETIDSQLQRIREQTRRVEDLASARETGVTPSPPWAPRGPGEQPDH